MRTELGRQVLDQLPLRQGEVDIWIAVVDEVREVELAAQFDCVLTADERVRHGRFLFEKDRRRYLVTRSLVRYVLSRYIPIAPADWRFEATEFGRPTIANDHPDTHGLTFNISHSDRVVLLGVTRDVQLGVDVEDLERRIPLDVADGFFSADEVRQLRSLPADLQPARFLDFWTLKESYIKARGKGLSLPLDQFGFDLSQQTGLQVWFDERLGDAPERWAFWQWRPSEGSIAALCLENRPGLEQRIAVRKAVPFVSEERIAFEVVSSSLHHPLVPRV